MTLTTQQRLIQTSARLFNAHGVEAVSIGQICEALAISPGNFTYYYKKRADLIDGHFCLLEAKLGAIIEDFPIHANPKGFSQALYRLMELVFNYRFLFLGAAYISRNELLATARYEQLVEHSKQGFVVQIERMIVEGHMTPVRPPYSVEALVDTIWWQWLGWLLAMQITPPKRTSTRKLVTEALINIMFVNQHYADRVFFRAIRAEIRRIGARAA